MLPNQGSFRFHLVGIEILVCMSGWHTFKPKGAKEAIFGLLMDMDLSNERFKFKLTYWRKLLLN